MPPEIWSKVIAAAVVPVVIISACGLLCLAFYNRLSILVARLRALQQETLKNQERLLPRPEGSATAVLARERVQEAVGVLGEEMDRLVARCHLIRRTLFSLLTAIACLVVCSLAAGASVVWTGALYVAGPAFLAGLTSVLVGVIFAMLELRVALEPVEMEHAMVDRLGERLPRHEEPTGEGGTEVV